MKGGGKNAKEEEKKKTEVTWDNVLDKIPQRRKTWTEAKELALIKKEWTKFIKN